MNNTNATSTNVATLQLVILWFIDNWFQMYSLSFAFMVKTKEQKVLSTSRAIAMPKFPPKNVSFQLMRWTHKQNQFCMRSENILQQAAYPQTNSWGGQRRSLLTAIVCKSIHLLEEIIIPPLGLQHRGPGSRPSVSFIPTCR